jgi:hypothetical protein
MGDVRTAGAVAGLEYLVLRRSLVGGAISLVGDTGYPAGDRGAAEQAALTAAAAAEQQGEASVHMVVRISESYPTDLTGLVSSSWLWVSETSYRGETWSSEIKDGRMSFAGLEQGPANPDAAAQLFLHRRLEQLAPDADEYDHDDDWWRVSVWQASRLDGTPNPAEGGRIADRAELLETPEKLAWLGNVLRAECVHPDAVATATPRQVSRVITQALAPHSRPT